MFTTIYPLYFPGAERLWVLKALCKGERTHEKADFPQKHTSEKNRDYRYIIAGRGLTLNSYL